MFCHPITVFATRVIVMAKFILAISDLESHIFTDTEMIHRNIRSVYFDQKKKGWGKWNPLCVRLPFLDGARKRFITRKYSRNQRSVGPFLLLYTYKKAICIITFVYNLREDLATSRLHDVCSYDLLIQFFLLVLVCPPGTQRPEWGKDRLLNKAFIFFLFSLITRHLSS